VAVLAGKPVAAAALEEPAAIRAYRAAAHSLEVPLPPVDGAGDSAQIATWVNGRVALIRAVVDDVKQLPPAWSDPLFATLVSVVPYVDLIDDIRHLPAPAGLAGTPEGATAYRAALDEKASGLSVQVMPLLKRCVELASVADEARRGWAHECRALAADLEALQARVPPPVTLPGGRARAPRARPAVLADCSGGEKTDAEPDALPPDLTASEEILVMYDDAELGGADRDKLVAAVTARLAKDLSQPFVKTADRSAAERLVTARKLRAGGPTCGQAPRLTQVLGMTHENLLIARVTTECLTRSKQPCELRVSFKRAGTYEPDGVPAKDYIAEVPQPASPRDWIAAASSLSNDKSSHIGDLLGMLRGSVGVELSVRGYGDDDAWLRLGDTLYGATSKELAACVDAAGSFDVSFSINGAGKVGKVATTAVTKPPAGSKLEACVQRALAATPFPCTRDGKPAQVEVRLCVAPAE